MTQANNTQTILELCLQLDLLAFKFYSRLSVAAENKELSEFWKSLAKDEGRHVQFWKKALASVKDIGLPQILDNARKVEEEMQKALEKGGELVAGCENMKSIRDCFTAAYRLEFYFMQPMLAQFFRLLGDSADMPDMEHEYNEHVERYLGGLARFGEVTPEMELLGETMRNLWSRNRELSIEATTDPLTGLMNRRSFFAIAYQVVHLAQRNRWPVGIMIADIDDFKQVNDTKGHKVGDRVIQGTADALKKAIRNSDFVGRYGGEEFIVLLPDADRNVLQEIGERIRGAVDKVATDNTKVTVSIGVADFTPESEAESRMEKAIIRADAALYAAKRAGKNRVVVDEK